MRKAKEENSFFGFVGDTPQVGLQAYKARYVQREQSVSSKPFDRKVVKKYKEKSYWLKQQRNWIDNSTEK